MLQCRWFAAVHGSVDVVHVKWCNCPSEDYNHAKGKETFPSLGFECITDFNRRILSVYGPHFGSRNDMNIVKTDTYGNAMTTNRIYHGARWSHYGQDCHVLSRGGYPLVGSLWFCQMVKMRIPCGLVGTLVPS